jgi:hypothetical protein
VPGVTVGKGRGKGEARAKPKCSSQEDGGVLHHETRLYDLESPDPGPWRGGRGPIHPGCGAQSQSLAGCIIPKRGLHSGDDEGLAKGREHS